MADSGQMDAAVLIARRAGRDTELRGRDRHAGRGPAGYERVLRDRLEPPAEIIVSVDDYVYAPGRDARDRLAFEVQEPARQRHVVLGELDGHVGERVG